jgi:molybdate transport system regulatory protein
MHPRDKHKPSGKIWIEYRGKPLVGKGGAEILQSIKDEESISMAARKLGMSYRYVWGYIQNMEKVLEEPVLETFRGGKSGGGGARLTECGESLLDEYRRLENYLNQILANKGYREVKNLKISARNRLKGKVVSVEKDGITAKVKIDVTAPSVVTAVITKEALEDLNIKVGDTVEAIIKSTEVIIAK